MPGAKSVKSGGNAIEPTTGGKPVGPCTVVIFGAGGDLTKRKLVPAIYNLQREGHLSNEFAIIGFARAPLGDDGYREKLDAEIKQFATSEVTNDQWKWLR